MINCATCGQPLGHIDEACAICLPGFWLRGRRGEAALTERLPCTSKVVARDPKGSAIGSPAFPHTSKAEGA